MSHKQTLEALSCELDALTAMEGAEKREGIQPRLVDFELKMHEAAKTVLAMVNRPSWCRLLSSVLSENGELSAACLNREFKWNRSGHFCVRLLAG
jgi:hypothetical protein